jgi:hypothetical protein
MRCQSDIDWKTPRCHLAMKDFHELETLQLKHQQPVGGRKKRETTETPTCLAAPVAGTSRVDAGKHNHIVVAVLGIAEILQFDQGRTLEYDRAQKNKTPRLTFLQPP